jgi:hypothetical protein
VASYIFWIGLGALLATSLVLAALAHSADREQLFRSIVNAHSGDRERSGATLVSR